MSAATTCSIPGFAPALLKAINQVRASGQVCGTEIMPPVAAVTWNDVLFSAAARHSQDMADQNYFSHVSLDGRSFSRRISNEGYQWQAAGENIAAGQISIPEVMAGWLASEGHCRNIMKPIYAEVGVACVAKSSTTYGTYWSMELGLQR